MNIIFVILLSEPLPPNLAKKTHTSLVAHLGHKKPQIVINVNCGHVDSSLQNPGRKSASSHARILHFGISGTPYSTTDMISKISWDIMKFCFPSPILKDKYVSHTSIYKWSCKRRVDTNRSDTPISKNISTMMSILNNVIGSLERVFQYLTESCSMHFCMVPGETRKYL